MINEQDLRVLRGGSARDFAPTVRCAYRFVTGPTSSTDYFGLRPARTFR
jgi:hypothetical protein